MQAFLAIISRMPIGFKLGLTGTGSSLLGRVFPFPHFISSGTTCTCVESVYSCPVDEVSTTSPMKAR